MGVRVNASMYRKEKRKFQRKIHISIFFCLRRFFFFLTQISVWANIFELTQINITQVNVLQISITQTNVPTVCISNVQLNMHYKCAGALP